MSDTHDQLKCERCQWRNSKNELADAEVIDVDGSSDGEGTTEESNDGSNSNGEAESIVKHYHPQIGMPPEEDLNNWGHHRAYDSVDDEIMQRAIEDIREELVSFAFSCRVDWQLLQDYHLDKDGDETQREEERKRKRLEKIAAAKKRAEEERAKSIRKSATKGKKRSEFIDDDEEESEAGGHSDEDTDDFASSSSSESEGDDVDEDDNVAEDVVSKSDDDESDVEIIAPPAVVSTPILSPKRNRPEDVIARSDDLSSSAKRRRIVKVQDDDGDDDDGFDDPLPIMPPTVAQESLKEKDGKDRSDSFASGAIIDEDQKESEPPEQHEAVDWSCSRCTLVNAAANDICAGCGLRFRRSRLQRPRFIDWDE
ncbi:hypothetical protein PINS_up008168 [Pythium insidiosum]|nr:hypothetical protein PINS_up008168 [Pythium insidiosum]